MSLITSEIFEEFINKGRFSVDEPGPLYSPIRNPEVKRDEKLNIILTTTSDGNAESSAVDHPAGTVRMNNDSIELTGIYGCKVRMNGIQPLGHTVSLDNSGNNIRTERSSVSSIEAIIEEAGTGKYLIEWLENVDDGSYIWPDLIKTNIENNTFISIGTDSNKIEMQEKSGSRNFGRCCIYLSIEEHQFYLVSSGEDKKSVGVKSGYILYLGTPTSESRKKIRNCLSFILGRPLIKIGYSVFDSEWQLVSFKSLSAYSMNGAAFSIDSLPPAPLGTNYQRELDSDIIARLVSSIYKNYELYNFGYLSWAYWHAVLAPIHIAAVHYGACIESLQKSYIANHGKAFERRLIDKQKWKTFRREALKVLENLELDDTENRVLENKINSLNQTPQSVLTERFFENLGINFSDIEKAAWQQRNNAAHGIEIEDGGVIELIRELNILKVIFHRVFLKIINGGEYYIDYYSFGFPIKFLSDSIDDAVLRGTSR